MKNALSSDTERMDPALARSRRAADRDAVLTAVMNGVTDPFMIPYVLALGGSAFQAGLLTSLRNLLVALVQLASAQGVRRLGSRRALVLWGTGLQAALWLPLACAEPLFGRMAVSAVLLLYTIGTASAALAAPAWGSLLADYVSADARGAYFGRRARLAGASTTIASASAGFVLQLVAPQALVGFAVLCAAAALSRGLACSALFRLHDPGGGQASRLDFGFLQFLRAAPRSNFARFTLCVGAQSFATHLAAPYFAVYLLEDQHYSYGAYTAVMLGGSLTGILCSPWWGRLGDRVGNHAVLRWCMLGVCPLPMLWLMSARTEWMVVANVLGAFLWGGISLAASNFIYDCVTPAKRHTCIAYFNVVNGLCVSAGAITGGWLAGSEQSAGGIAFETVFIASALLRLSGALGLRRFVRETRVTGTTALRDVILDGVGQRLVGLRMRLTTGTGGESQRRLRGRDRPAA
jgi:MFS family permease